MPTVLDRTRLSQAKRAFSTRRVAAEDLQILLDGDDLASHAFRAGDLALARVDRIGHHTRIERVDGRKARLFEGDEIIVALGARYAPDQYEAMTPSVLGPCHLAAAGGVAGRIIAIHDRIIRPTEITLVGLIGSVERRPINLADYAVEQDATPISIPAVIVVGTAMNAGKTTTAAGLVRGLAAAGMRPGAAKATGTGAGGDFWFYTDAGAHHVTDFVDAGFVSTYLETPEALEASLCTQMRALQRAGCDVAVLEISDGLAQRETAALLNRDALRALSSTVVFAAREAAGAAHGSAWLRQRGFDVAGVSGMITRSPLAMREFDELDGGRCLTFEQLCSPDVAGEILWPATAADIGIAS